MIKINGLSENEVLTICNTVAANHSSKTFSYYDKDDISQQVWIIITQQITKFDSTRITTKSTKQGLENWLNNVVSRRLKNFFRDNHDIKQQPRKIDKTDAQKIKRKSLQNPITLDNHTYVTDNMNTLMSVEYRDLWNYICQRLDYDNFQIFDSLLSGECIQQYYKTKLSAKIKSLISEYNNV